MIFGIILFILGILVLNTMFLAIPYLSPRIDHIEVISYQIFGNMLLFLFMVLPSHMGSYDLLRNE